MTANKEVADALDEYAAAGEAFRAAVRSGGHGLAEYEEWRNARGRAIAAQGRIVNEFNEADRARVAEHGELVKEARRIRGVISDTGGRHRGIPGWRAAWLERASAYAGHAVTDLDASLIEPPPYPKGAERPWPLHLPPIPPYESELREMAGNGSR